MLFETNFDLLHTTFKSMLHKFSPLKKEKDLLQQPALHDKIYSKSNYDRWKFKSKYKKDRSKENLCEVST